jgi:hypothetical protein
MDYFYRNLKPDLPAKAGFVAGKRTLLSKTPLFLPDYSAGMLSQAVVVPSAERKPRRIPI